MSHYSELEKEMQNDLAKLIMIIFLFLLCTFGLGTLCFVLWAFDWVKF